MLNSLIVGLGHSGAGLHAPVLTRLRWRVDTANLFADAPPVGVDPYTAAAVPGVTVVRTLRQAYDLTDPARTLVHLCTPPTQRVAVLADLAELGYRRILVEKPLAMDERALEEIHRLRQRWDLRLTVVSQWLSSSLSRRIREILDDGRLGPVREMVLVSRKSRYARSLVDRGHPTAFDVEVPHAVALALRLAGPARVTAAELGDLTVGGTVLRGLGQARLTLTHPEEVRARIRSELGAPVRERRITVRCAGGTLVGHFPCSAADPYSHLRVAYGGTRIREVLHDDALTEFILDAYRAPETAWPEEATFALHSAGVRLLAAAKRMAAGAECRPAPRHRLVPA